MQNPIEGNLRTWDREHSWLKDGDEWDGQARYCGVSYDEWKHSLIGMFLSTHLGPDLDVLEIAPGHGRWTEYIAPNCRSLTLVDLSPQCIDFCKQRFAGHQQISYIVTDGKSLSGVLDDSQDFIWSFDAFVHMDRNVIRAYFREAARVLRPGGGFTVHHAGRRNSTLSLGFLKKWGSWGRDFYKTVSLPDAHDNDGWRSDISPELIRCLARDAGLRVGAHVNSWGEGARFGVRRYGDWITILNKPDTA